MEQKLKEFQSRRRREMLLNKPKEIFQGLMGKIFSAENPLNRSISGNSLHSSTLEDSRVYDEDAAGILSSDSDELSVSPPLEQTSCVDVLIKLLSFSLWVITYLIAVHFEFGFVFVIMSSLLFIYFNTRTGPKKKGEISAYSVFNPDCEAIQGTLKAEQFEKEFNLIQH